MKVLAIMPHCDDEQLIIGTLFKHSHDEDNIFEVFITNGEKIGNPRKRSLASLICAELIGARGLFLDFPDTEVQADICLIKRLEKIIEEIKPDRIYIPSLDDTHQDHRNTAYASLTAARKVKEILFYETPSSQINFNANYFVDISKWINKKKELIKILAKSIPRRRYLLWEAIKGKAYARGLESNVEFAEAFKIFRMIQ